MYYFRLFFILLTLITPIARAAPAISSEDELDGYVTIVDDNNHVLLQTGIITNIGDSFINENNKRYEVVSVEGNLAKAHLAAEASFSDTLNEAWPVQGQTATSEQPDIAIYHTHTDESYIPTNGQASTPGKGSIISVGSIFAEKLSALGFQVEHNKTLHEPHDANAYQRSRRTFLKLLTKKPAALFDLHRDSAPLEAYKTTINGKSAVKLVFVVGRTNQNFNATVNYAKQLKNVTDQKYRGLVKGIFIAKGNYNQDLTPHAMLIEVGTQFNSLEDAKQSISLFSDVLPSVIQISRTSGTSPGTPPAPQARPEENQPLISERQSVWNDSVILIITVIISSLIYLILSTRDIMEAKYKLRNFFSREWKDLFRKKRN